MVNEPGGISWSFIPTEFVMIWLLKSDLGAASSCGADGGGGATRSTTSSLIFSATFLTAAAGNDVRYWVSAWAWPSP